MNLVDANVLIYAVNTESTHHRAAKTWLDAALSGGSPVGFAWTALIAFIRITTKPGLFTDPLSTAQATGTVRMWLDQSAAHVLHPTPRHLDVLTGLLAELGTGGNVVADAHLAALAIEHNANVVTFDRDFGRFPGLRWSIPS